MLQFSFNSFRRMTVPSSSYYTFSCIISRLTWELRGVSLPGDQGLLSSTSLHSGNKSLAVLVQRSFKFLVFFVFSLGAHFIVFPTIVLPKVICCEFCTCVYTVVSTLGLKTFGTSLVWFLEQHGSEFLKGTLIMTDDAYFFRVTPFPFQPVLTKKKTQKKPMDLYC